MDQAGEQAGMEKGTAEHTAPIVWPNSLALPSGRCRCCSWNEWVPVVALYYWTLPEF